MRRESVLHLKSSTTPLECVGGGRGAAKTLARNAIMGNLAQSNNIVVVVYFGGLQVLRVGAGGRPKSGVL